MDVIFQPFFKRPESIVKFLLGFSAARENDANVRFLDFNVNHVEQAPGQVKANSGMACFIVTQSFVGSGSDIAAAVMAASSSGVGQIVPGLSFGTMLDL
ncbi:MAG: hypothetical protein LZF84_03325 [Nitrosomonas sp.]|nr:MAG: hypothetical protein LZF84_03325 [Nitrosomonas sp.]